MPACAGGDGDQKAGEEMNRDRVIKALENCTDAEKCQDCPWAPCKEFDYPHSDYPDDLIKAALDLLKATPKVQIIGVYGFTAHSSKDLEYAEERKQMAEHLAKDMAIQLLQEGLIQITEHDRENTPMDEDFYPDGFNAVIGVKIKIVPPYGWKETADE